MRLVRRRAVAAILALSLGLASAPLAALAAERGRVTNMPIPRYVSLKSSVGNARRGPSAAQQIDWVFTRKDMPLQIIGEYDNWRQVRDSNGATGWMHYSLLSGVRTVIVEKDLLALRVRPEDSAAAVAHAEVGVIARLGECSRDWCRISADGYKGWARKTALWGVDAGEIRD